jgi:hypothetical protein
MDGSAYADRPSYAGGCIVKLTPVRGACRDGTCPTIYTTDRGTVVVQGYTVTDADVSVPEGEALVEIPAELLKSDA